MVSLLPIIQENSSDVIQTTYLWFPKRKNVCTHGLFRGNNKGDGISFQKWGAGRLSLPPLCFTTAALCAVGRYTVGASIRGISLLARLRWPTPAHLKSASKRSFMKIRTGLVSERSPSCKTRATADIIWNLKALCTEKQGEERHSAPRGLYQSFPGPISLLSHLHWAGKMSKAVWKSMLSMLTGMSWL